MRAASGPDWPAIDRLLAAYKPAVLVVGYPYNEDGTPGALAGAADRFAAALARARRDAVARVDERVPRRKPRGSQGAARHGYRPPPGAAAGSPTASRPRSSLGRWLRGEY